MATKRTSAAAGPVHAGDLSNIEACVQDVARAASDPDQGQRDPTGFAPLREARGEGPAAGCRRPTRRRWPRRS